MLPNVLDLINFRQVFSFVKKAFIVIFVFVVVISLFLHFSSSDRAAVNISSAQLNERMQTDLYNKVNDPALQKTQQGKMMIVVYKKMNCFVVGEFCTDNPKDSSRYKKNSLVGMIAGFIAFPYVNPPASGVYWAYDTFQNAGFIPKTYAAEGIGFAALRPIINLWKVFRDIAYLVLVLVLMVIGFMIMFRMKLNPQTVISLENALPKIVVSLILITFSFAIAGFVIDLMYVVIVLVISLLSSGGSSTGAAYNVGDMQKMYLEGNGLGLWNSIFANPAGKSGLGILNLIYIGSSLMTNLLTALPAWLSSIIFIVVNGVIGYVFTQVIFSILFKLFGVSLNDVSAGIATAVLGSGKLAQLFTWVPIIILALQIGFSIGPPLIMILLGVVVFFTLLGLYFRIFFILFRSYLQILILVILSPIILLVEAVPGKSTFSFWLKNLMAEVMTFPIVIAIMTMGFVISNQLVTEAYHVGPGGQTTFWRPPFMNIIDPTTLPILVGLGFILITPDLVKMAKEQVFGVKGLPINLGIGTFFAGAGAAGGGTMSLLGQISTVNLGLQALTGKPMKDLLKTSKAPESPRPAASQSATPPVPGGG